MVATKTDTIAWYYIARLLAAVVLVMINAPLPSMWKDVRYLYAKGRLTRYVTLRVAHAPGMPGTFSPPPTSKEIASYRFRHASRHVRDARAVMHVGIDNPRWLGNVPGIPGACATRNFTYLARGPLLRDDESCKWKHVYIHNYLVTG